MRTLRRISVALVALGALSGCVKPTLKTTETLAPTVVRETFESGISDAFVPCLRPENEFTTTDEQARNGTKSYKLTIRKLRLFEHLRPPIATLATTPPCLAALTPDEARKYLNDDSERAELKEKKSGSPHFTEDFYYGFSLMIPRTSAPVGDFNRMVVGQWKLSRNHELPAGSFPYDSPFLAIRVTGGFFHIMLTVKAEPQNGAMLSPEDCRVLLAFTSEAPPNHERRLDLSSPAQCESRLNYDLNQGQPSPPGSLQIHRSAYLPSPWDSWIDLVFHIKGGDNGIVEVWAQYPGAAQATLIARATGWIGYEGIDDRVDTQYFKFGPYRDPAGYDAVIYLDNLARGHSYADVDPSAPP